MKIEKWIPQYLPMYGSKIRIYYKNVVKICTRCYEGGHIRKDCQNNKKQWIDYVSDFMNTNPDIPKEFYGRWSEVVENEINSKEKRTEDENESTGPEVGPEPNQNPEAESGEGQQQEENHQTADTTKRSEQCDVEREAVETAETGDAEQEDDPPDETRKSVRQKKSGNQANRKSEVEKVTRSSLPRNKAKK